MSSLEVTYLGYAALALALVSAATWSLYRYSAPLLFDVVDADELVVAGIHRLITAGHVLLSAAAAGYLAPSSTDVHRGPGAALFSSLGGLLALLAVLHLGVLALFFAVKYRLAERAFPPVQPGQRVQLPRTVLIPGATPPTVPLPPPVFHAPRGVVPPGIPAPPVVAYTAWTSPPPAGPRLAPPYPPPWCTPLPPTYDSWVPPRR